MSIPPTAPRQQQLLDPSDQLDFYAVISRGSGRYDILQEGEGVASFGLALPADSYAAGLRLLTDTAHAPRLENLVLSYWLKVEPSVANSPVFDSPGLEFGIELTIVTDNVPPRTKQRTIVNGVVQL